MILLCLGLNHKTAPIALRERVAFVPEQLAPALQQLHAFPAVAEVAILSTCNRAELYLLCHSSAIISIKQWLANFHATPLDQLDAHLYQHTEAQAVQHMCAVAVGLDSLVLGEPQILGQLKSAWRLAQQQHTLGPVVDRWFQHSFAVAKQVRHQTQIGAHAVSVAYAAVRLARQVFGELSEQTALLIGAGETIELVSKHLLEAGLTRIIIANRSAARAHELTKNLNITAEIISLEQLPEQLFKADIVISSTAAADVLLTTTMVKAALKQRRHRPIFMADLAVPRDIEASVGQLNDVYLYSVDDLEHLLEDNVRARQQAAERAQAMIAERIAEFLAWRSGHQLSDVICELRERAQSIRDQALHKAQQQLAQGKAADAVLQQLAHSLTNKLIHPATQHLRQAAEQGDIARIQSLIAPWR